MLKSNDEGYRWFQIKRICIRPRQNRILPLSSVFTVQKKSCPGVPLSRDKGRSKNPGTNSSVPGRPRTKSLTKKHQKKGKGHSKRRKGCSKSGQVHSKTGKDVLKQEIIGKKIVIVPSHPVPSRPTSCPVPSCVPFCPACRTVGQIPKKCKETSNLM